MPLPRRHFLYRAALAAAAALPAPALLLAAAGAHAAASDAPLHVVVGYPPGGATDLVARYVSERLAVRLGRPVIVDNKPGAGGRLAAQQVKATPAGQEVVMVANPAVMVIAPLVFQNNGYDPDRDFQPLSLVNRYDFGLAVARDVPVANVAQLLDWMRANRSQANVGVPATGSLPHFFALMLGTKARVPTEVVGYKGSATLVSDLIGGQVPVAVDTLDVQLPQYEAGKMRILAMSGAERSPFAPAVPTFKESGLDLAASGWNAFFAPASMPRERADALAAHIRAVMLEPETQRRFNASKLAPVASTRAETAATIKSFRTQWAPVVRASGYTP